MRWGSHARMHSWVQEDKAFNVLRVKGSACQAHRPLFVQLEAAKFLHACLCTATTQSRKNADEDAPGHQGIAGRDARRMQAHGDGASAAEQCSARELTLLLAALLARCVV